MTPIPCAIYTRKSSEEGLEQSFNSLDAQREACAAYVLSQKAQGWRVMDAYDDGGFSGGNVERPGLKRLLADIHAGRVKVVVVYKVDRLTRSLADFAKLVELFDARGVSFVSVTQQFNTTSSMGRLTLNVLLSFAQFEREVTGERIRDKIAASKRKGMWMGGFAPMGYLPRERTLVIDEPQAQRVREIFTMYLELRGVYALKAELDRRGWKTPEREGRRIGGGRPFTRGHLYRMLANPIYIGRISHKGTSFPGQHPPIVDEAIYEKAQALLLENAQGHDLRSDAADPSVLAGMLFDSDGRRLKPTHAKKGAKRYRYYFRPADAGETSTLRIPAPELEGVVLQGVLRFLNDETRLLTVMDGVGATEARERIAGVKKLAQDLATGVAALKIELLKRVLERVKVHSDSIEIAVSPAGLGWTSEAEAIRIVVPVQLRRCGLAVRLVVHAIEDQRPREPDRRLIDLLAKAQRWFQALSTGIHPSVLSLAQEHGMPTAEVTRIVYLAFLAPEIVQRIARGEQPPGLGIKRLLAAAPLPLDWTEQRRALGFDG